MPGLRSLSNIRRGIIRPAGGTELDYDTYPGILFNTPVDRQGGVWYDPSDMSTLFQDIEMTQPVTESGQRVAVMLDKSGNNHHMYQEDESYRPEFVIEGTRKFLRFSKAREDFLATESGRVASLTLTNFHAFALYRQQTSSTGDFPRIISAGSDTTGGSTGFAIGPYNSSNIWGAIRTNGTRFDYTGNTGTPAPLGVYEFKYDGSKMGVTYQGETESTTNYSSALSATNSRIVIGRSTNSSGSLSTYYSLFGGDWYGYFHVNRVLTTSEINECRTWARKQITSIGLPDIIQRTLPSTQSSVTSMTYSNGALKISRSGNTIAHSSTGLHAWRISESGTATKVSFSGNDTTTARKALAISPDGDMILTGRTTTNTTVQINKWNGSSYSMIGEVNLLNGYTGVYVADMDFSPDGQYLAITFGSSASETRTGVWKRNGDTFDTPIFYSSAWTSSTGATKGVKWMHNGTHFVVTCGSTKAGRVFSFNGSTVSSVHSYTTEATGIHIGFSSDDRCMVASAGNLSGVYARAFIVRESNKNIFLINNNTVASAKPMLFKRDGSLYALVPRYNSGEMNLWKFNGYNDAASTANNLAYQVGSNERSWLLEDLGLSDLVSGTYYYFSDFVHMSDRTRIAFTTTSSPYLRVWDIPYDSVS